ncbi:MAG: PLP-dependent transferase [Geminicoccaceae bacterium]
MTNEPDKPAAADHLATLLAHDPLERGPVVPPIVQSSLFTFASVEQMTRVFAGEDRRPIYSRGDNPTVQAFEAKMAALEGGEAARGFSSGMGAVAATILAFVSAGDKMVCVRHVYPDTYRLIRRLLPRLGIETVFVDGRDREAVQAALESARLLYIENPTSVIFQNHDIAALAALGKAAGAVTEIDNSWATPVQQKPLVSGVDLALHSAAKYLSGHSDTVAGVVIGSAQYIETINRLTYPFLGAKLAPFEAWLLLRGLRTLKLRMAQHQTSALAIAQGLGDHPKVTNIHHPGLASEPNQLVGTSGLFSIELASGVDVALFCDRLRLFRLGVSWGGHESLVFPAMVGLRQAGEHNSLRDFGISERLVRLSVGLEEPNDLIADLEQALTDA